MIKKFVISTLMGISLYANKLDDYSVVASNKTSSLLPSSISLSELTFLYSDRLHQLSNGLTVHIIVLPLSNASQRYLLRNVLGINMTTFSEIIKHSTHFTVVKKRDIVKALKSKRRSIAVMDAYTAVYYGDSGKLCVVRIEDEE